MLRSVPVRSLRAIHTEQPPPGVFASFTGLPVEIDFHRTVGTGLHLVPVFANIQFRTSMVAFPGFAPGAQYTGYPDGLAPPKELTGETGLPDCHARRVARSDHRCEGFADQLLR